MTAILEKAVSPERETSATASASTSFPLNSFREAAVHLRRPFTPEAVKFKVQATYPKQNPTGAIIVSYIDARLVVERLNLIVPHLWWDAYEASGKDLICALTVDGITRRDVGQEQGGVKGLYSDALKRAAVKFGIGVSLYATPKIHLKVSDGTLKSYKDSLVMTPEGEGRARTIYRMWLESHGAEAFGEPLSHGDVEGAQGDAEVDDETVEPASSPQAVSAPAPGPIADALEVAKIYTSADARKLPNRGLANIVLHATGNKTRDWTDEDTAGTWLERALKQLPADKVQPVLAAIAKGPTQ